MLTAWAIREDIDALVCKMTIVYDKVARVGKHATEFQTLWEKTEARCAMSGGVARQVDFDDWPNQVIETSAYQ